MNDVLGYMNSQKVLISSELSNVIGGKLVKLYTAEPYTFYRDTRTKKIVMRQTTGYSAHLQHVIADGWVRSAHL
ncbi:lactococcin family bacteriocin [Lactiplantibacillus xiangfangensis]